MKILTKLKWLLVLIDIYYQQKVKLWIAKYETLVQMNKQNYHRLMPNLINASSERDDISPKNISNLKFINENQEVLNLIVRKLISDK